MKKSGLLFVLCLIFLGCTNNDEECPQPEGCYLEPESGQCMALFHRYYFDKTEKKCKEFIWGGCGGVVPFNTLEECQQCECE